MPQFILEDYARKGKVCNIICTQPRRLAATTLAATVASQRGEQVGSTVGFQIQFERKASRSTSLLYCTAGILSRMLESKENPAPVEEITHIIIDEAHERNLDTDVILCLMRDVLRRFPKLRLILMSASMNSGLWEKHFRDFAPLHVECPGKLFPVSQLFLEETLYLMKLPPSHAVFEHNYSIDWNASCKISQDYKGKNLVIDYSLVVNIVEFIHLRCIPGAILIFLPGVPEMVLLENELSKSSASFNAGKLEV